MAANLKKGTAMKVAVQTPNMGGAFKYILRGIINALSAADVRVSTQPHFELTDDDNIDLYIGSLSFGRGYLYNEKPFRRLTNCKYALHSQPFVDGLADLKGIANLPRLNPSESERRLADQINPDVLWGYGWEIHADLWEKWDRKWQSFMPAGDSVEFFDLQGGRPDQIVFLGGDWPYKRPSIDEILNAIKQMAPDVRLKIAGWGRNNTVPLGGGNRWLNSGLVGFCPSEPHTKVLGIDIPERVFKLPLAGVAAVHDKVPFLGQMLPSVPIGGDGIAIAELCFSLLDHEMNRLAVQIAQKHWVLRHHTYFCRLKCLAKALEMPLLEQKMAEKIPK